MVFRGRLSQRRKNDGLPVINGRKIQRRSHAGVTRSPYQNSNNSPLQSHIWTIAAVVMFILLLVSQNDTEQSPSGTTVSSQEANVASTPANVPSPPATTNAATLPLKGEFPAQCTPAQLERAKIQLPDDKWSFRPWRDASFSLATVRSEYAYNPILMREFYASSDFSMGANVPTFFGISLGWRSNAFPIDMLAIGARDPVKYNLQKWNDELKLGPNKSLPPVSIDTSSGSRKAKYAVVDFEQEHPNDVAVSDLKAKFGLSDEELTLAAGTNSIKDVLPAADQPIHYMDIFSQDGDDAHLISSVLLGTHSDKMKQVRFLHFDYNGRGSYGTYKLSSIIQKLKNHGLVCYFAGNKEADYGFWRITDCFLDYYDHPHWAWISCVNVQHDDVKMLAQKIEAKFLATLPKSHTFPMHG